MNELRAINRLIDHCLEAGRYPNELKISERYFTVIQMAEGYHPNHEPPESLKGYYRGVRVIAVITKRAKGKYQHPDNVCVLHYSEKDPRRQQDELQAHRHTRSRHSKTRGTDPDVSRAEPL